MNEIFFHGQHGWSSIRKTASNTYAVYFSREMPEPEKKRYAHGFRVTMEAAEQYARELCGPGVPHETQ